MHKQQLLITFFSLALLFCNASGMDKQICPHDNSAEGITCRQNSVTEDRMETLLQWSPIIKQVTPQVLQPNTLRHFGFFWPKKPKPEPTEKKLEDEKNRLEQELNEKKQKTGFWSWFLHYTTKIGSILTGGFVHWLIGNRLSTFDSSPAQTHELKKFAQSTFKQSIHPTKRLGVALLSRTPFIKKIAPPIPPAPPKDPPLKELANPSRLLFFTPPEPSKDSPLKKPSRLIFFAPFITKLTVSAIEACEQSFKEYLNDEKDNVSPKLIIKRTMLFFAQKNLRDYFVPLVTVATRTRGPKITKEIRQIEHDLATVNWNLKTIYKKKKYLA